jgi:hypothetical protein
MKIFRTLTAAICLTLFIALMAGCAFQDHFIPNYIDKRVGERTGAEMTSLNPFYTTLADAKRLGRELNFVSVEKREALLQEIEKGGRLDTFLAEGHAVYMLDANTLRKTLFGPTGVVSAFAGLIGLGAGTFLLKRPGDLRKEDVEEV